MAGAFPADPAARYAVRLFFSDYRNLAPGTRVFDLRVGGILALSDFDIVDAAAGRLVGVVRTFLVCPCSQAATYCCTSCDACRINRATLATLTYVSARKYLATRRCGRMRMA